MASTTNVILFLKDRKQPLKYRNVKNINSLISFVVHNYGAIRYYNVYDSVTKKFIEQIKIQKNVI